MLISTELKIAPSTHPGVIWIRVKIGHHDPNAAHQMDHDKKRKEKSNQTVKTIFDFCKLLEVFEHFVNPMLEIEKLLDISDTIIFSTDLRPNPVPQPKDWWYFGLEHGQHIAFYSTRTFKYIAKQLQLHYCNLGSLHVLSRREIPTWKLNASKGSAFGFHKVVERLMASKTWSDHELMKKIDK